MCTENNLWELVLPFYHVSPRNPTIRLGEVPSSVRSRLTSFQLLCPVLAYFFYGNATQWLISVLGLRTL